MPFNQRFQKVTRKKLSHYTFDKKPYGLSDLIYKFRLVEMAEKHHDDKKDEKSSVWPNVNEITEEVSDNGNLLLQTSSFSAEQLK